MSKSIEIKIDSEKLSPEQFLDASKAFVAVVQGVGKNIAGRLLKWTVEVDKGSAVLRLCAAAESRDYDDSIKAISSGLSGLGAGVRRMPHGFTKLEMNGLRTLASLLGVEGMREISIRNGSSDEPVSHDSISLIDSIVTREKHKEYGSIEGIVVNISLRQGFICTLYDPIERRDIPCYLQNQESQDAVFMAASRRSRVLADGQIHYSEDDIPINITADFIRVFPEEQELPTLAEVQAIYKSHK